MLCLFLFACFSVAQAASRQGEWDISSFQTASFGHAAVVGKNFSSRPLKPVAQNSQIKFPGGIRINTDSSQDMLLAEDRTPGLASTRFGVRAITAAHRTDGVYTSRLSRAPPTV